MIKNLRAEPYGILFIDKSQKLTSHDVVDIIRKKLKIKRVGHTGTLDPLATGLLIILVGKSTKMQDKFQKLDKVYEGNIKFGMETDTWDTDGKILKQIKVEIMEKSVKSAIDLLSGNIIQQVPPYSAVKYKGQTLYKLARQNKSVPSINRVVNVNWLDWRIRGENLGFKIKCSSGTYIRSIA
ncbi:MAG: tRNA pseudouridine(55) synthase TruB, partial [Elusimicrobiales bacterium]|nr:tRNA pseudouridine(55) synthase TruB [Elusimicrobiales bacterium]